MTSEPAHVAEFELTREKLVAAIKVLFHQCLIRRIAIRGSSGTAFLRIPLLLALLTIALLPVFMTVAALSALVVRCSLVVERAAEQRADALSPQDLAQAPSI